MPVSAPGLAVLAWVLPGVALPLTFALTRLHDSFPPQLELSRCREVPRAGDDLAAGDTEPLAEDEVLLGESLACPRDVVDRKGWRDVLAVASSESVLIVLSGGGGLLGVGCAVLAVRRTWRSRHGDATHRRAFRLGLAALVVWLSGATLALAGLLFVLAAAPIRG